MHDKLRVYFEQELAMLETSIDRYAKAFPKIAARMGIVNGRTDDPNVQRIIQASALIAAKARFRLDQGAPSFTGALLDNLHPHYRRPVPACAIAEIRCGKESDVPVSLLRGTQILTSDKIVKFRTTYTVARQPVQIKAARFTSSSVAPARVKLPEGVTSLISLTLDTIDPAFALARIAPDTLRFHVTGDAPFVATLIDTLLLKTTRAYVEADASGQWTVLDRIPLASVGFADKDMLFPIPTNHSFFQPLLEYVTFPQKHHFLDLALKPALGMSRTRQARSVTLHFAIAQLHPDSLQAQTLGALNPDRLRTGCTPVVNLIPHVNVPAPLDMPLDRYPVVPDKKAVKAHAVYCVDAVRWKTETNTTVYLPRHAMQHRGNLDPRQTGYWMLQHDDYEAVHAPGTETSVQLVHLDGTIDTAGPSLLTVDVIATNRDLPEQLQVGQPDGDLFVENGDAGTTFNLLSRPTPAFTLPDADDDHWRLLNLSTQNATKLTAAGWVEFIDVLGRCLPPTNAKGRYFEATSWVRAKTIRIPINMKPTPILAVALEITIALDESAFAGHSIATFIELIDRYLARFVPTLQFTQLVVQSKSNGSVIRRCPPREGLMPIV